MSVRVGTTLFIIWSLITSITHAAPELNNLSITVDGIDYAVELEKSDFAARIEVHLGTSTTDNPPNIELYQGTAPEIPGSWVAASYQDGDWQGVASVHDKLYELKGFGISGTELALVEGDQTVSMQAEEMQMTGDFDINNMCASPHDMKSSAETSVLNAVIPAQNNSTQSPVAALAVNGITLAVNVVLTLDHNYLNSYNADAVPRAMRILNVVDTIYRNSLGIALNNTAIQTFNNGSPLFAGVTDASNLLDMVRLNQPTVFGNSPRTLGAVLTTRNIAANGNAGVAGIAYINATCNNIAVSVNEDRNTEGVASIILAHEMGHNFGANHDPGNALCPNSTYIMSAVVANGLTEFSSCSRTDIGNHTNGGTCYKEPIDIALAKFGAAPPDNLAQQQEINRQVSVTNNGTLTVNNVQIDGDIDNVALASFSEVTVNGQACSLLAAGKSYRCTIASIAAAAQQIITEKIQTAGLGTFAFTSSFDSSNVTQRIDIVTNNQRVSDNRTVNQAAAAPVAPSGFSASAQNTGDIALSWADNSNNEQNIIVQRLSNGGAFATIANLAANSTSHTDSYTNLTVGTAYTYRVLAMNAIGNTPSNQSTATALERTVSSNSPTPSNDSSSDSGGGGGGAFYLLTAVLLFARAAKSFK